MEEQRGREGDGIPLVAVVIPTRGRENRLAFALEALAGQTLARSDFEVIVARDSDATPPFAEECSAIAVTSLALGEVAGPTAKRNLGWRKARAPLIAFTDDDCRPEPDWLERLLEAAARHPNSLLQGRTVPDPDEEHLLHGFARSRRVIAKTKWFEASNIAYPRDLLVALNGFDERFYFGGEDTDLGLRAVAAGAEHVFIESATVRHAVLARSLRQAVQDSSSWESAPLVVALHPQQRRALFARFFMKDSHAWFLLALLGAAASRRSRWLALAALPYVLFYVDGKQIGTLRLLRLCLHMPARALVDGAEVLATARAAVKHRVAVL